MAPELLQRVDLLAQVLAQEARHPLVPERLGQADGGLVLGDLVVLGAHRRGRVEPVPQRRRKLLHLVLSLLPCRVEHVVLAAVDRRVELCERRPDVVGVASRLLEMLGERLPELLVLRFLLQLREDGSRQRLLDRQQLSELLAEQLARVLDLRRLRCLSGAQLVPPFAASAE